eukprot:CAMPEP_0184559078 /NCGR_PEP_ID=MMETSP0199_2-20130426/46248_1 /TAXON_ID=1112570 /ORGANISM="Thraustochytrium sp., Strain LLF1b" /LENGTH=251 /DNA_ID=CAMNT_0026956361 /DNA_START=649 /DNA_END=1401 /DNA_ORIENTATION=+
MNASRQHLLNKVLDKSIKAVSSASNPALYAFGSSTSNERVTRDPNRKPPTSCTTDTSVTTTIDATASLRDRSEFATTAMTPPASTPAPANTPVVANRTANPLVAPPATSQADASSVAAPAAPPPESRTRQSQPSQLRSAHIPRRTPTGIPNPPKPAVTAPLSAQTTPNTNDPAAPLLASASFPLILAKSPNPPQSSPIPPNLAQNAPRAASTHANRTLYLSLPPLASTRRRRLLSPEPATAVTVLSPSCVA